MFLFSNQVAHPQKMQEAWAAISWIRWTIKSGTGWSLFKRSRLERKDLLQRIISHWWRGPDSSKLWSRYWLKFRPIIFSKRLRGTNIVSFKCTCSSKIIITYPQIHRVWMVLLSKMDRVLATIHLLRKTHWIRQVVTVKMYSQMRSKAHQTVRVVRIVDIVMAMRVTCSASRMSPSSSQIRKLQIWVEETHQLSRSEMIRNQKEQVTGTNPNPSRDKNQVILTAKTILTCGTTMSNKNLTGSKSSCRKEWWVNPKVSHNL